MKEFGGEVSRGWFSVDLMVLWRTVEIVRCDTEELSQQLTREIYSDSPQVSSGLYSSPNANLSQEIVEDIVETEVVEKYYSEVPETTESEWAGYYN